MDRVKLIAEDGETTSVHPDQVHAMVGRTPEQRSLGNGVYLKDWRTATDALSHLRRVSNFIRNYPVLPSLQLRQTGRSLSVGEGPTRPRRNPWSLYQELANHIDDYIAEIASSPAPVPPPAPAATA